jgi:diaminopropionate ammonia-lyase family
MSSIYLNPSASSFTTPSTTSHSEIQSFHSQLPHFKHTPLAPLKHLADQFDVKDVLVKDESSRCALPAFKILGASWATFRAITSLANLPLSTPLSELAGFAQKRNLSLYTATDGNHGRAIARMSALLGISAHIYVPRFTDPETRAKIRSESDNVTVHGTDGEYDAAVFVAYAASRGSPQSLFIEDTSFEGYEDVPRWCVEGYSTLLHEIEDAGVKATHVVVPIGCGGLGDAAVSFSKSEGRGIKVIAIEPERAACLHASLRAGEMRTIETSDTIMDGMNCGSLSAISWEVLKGGVDASLTICDEECHDAVQYLQGNGVNAGPCGAGTLAGFRKLMADREAVGKLGIGEESVVVLLSTEGKRGYKVPE